jgi:hypothetical protein
MYYKINHGMAAYAFFYSLYLSPGYLAHESQRGVTGLFFAALGHRGISFHIYKPPWPGRCPAVQH